MHIHTLSLACNCYIVEGTDRRAVVIDPGADASAVTRALSALSLTPAAVFLTHAHYDHVRALTEIVDTCGIPVYLEENEVPYLTDTSLNLSATLFCDPYRYTGRYTALADGKTVTAAGLDFQIIHTPGHTDGSCCFLTDGVLFSGDTLFAGAVGRTDFPHGSYPTLLNSLKKLAELPDNVRVLPGHEGATTIGEEKRSNPYFAAL